MTLLITINVGEITYNAITYNWFYLQINDFTYNSI
jgi:hypothetical protein